MKHTPGPWHIEYTWADHMQRCEVFGPNEDEWVADCGIGGNSRECAKLIAAAPELLEAAFGVGKLYAELMAVAPIKPELMDYITGIVKQAQAAIAKAGGK